MISKLAQISPTAIIHENVTIEDYAIIRDYVVIYPNTIIRKNVDVYDHCVLGKPPTTAGGNSRPFEGIYGDLVIGENSVLCPSVVLYCGTRIGNHTLLGDYCSIRENCTVGDKCILSRNVSVNYSTTIGNRVKIMDNSHITGDMIIEDDVFISVLVSTTNDNTMDRQAYSSSHVRGPIIRRFATIGAAANLLPNVCVGENAIVGAGALVTKDVPEKTVVMGVPARHVRELSENELKG